MKLLHFHADRTITIDLDDGAVTLRPPNIGEWRLLFALWEQADSEMKALPEDQRPGALWGDLGGVNPYAEALAETIGMLSTSAKPDPEKLPMWAGLPGMFTRLYLHWRVAEFEYVDMLDPFAPPPEPTTEPEPQPQPTTSPRSERDAAAADIAPVDLAELAATAPVPATGGISQRGETNMG